VSAWLLRKGSKIENVVVGKVVNVIRWICKLRMYQLPYLGRIGEREYAAGLDVPVQNFTNGIRCLTFAAGCAVRVYYVIEPQRTIARTGLYLRPFSIF
jgi:hypothetical protein